jgi:hypothetical protein
MAPALVKVFLALDRILLASLARRLPLLALDNLAVLLRARRLLDLRALELVLVLLLRFLSASWVWLLRVFSLALCLYFRGTDSGVKDVGV